MDAIEDAPSGPESEGDEEEAKEEPESRSADDVIMAGTTSGTGGRKAQARKQTRR